MLRFGCLVDFGEAKIVQDRIDRRYQQQHEDCRRYQSERQTSDQRDQNLRLQAGLGQERHETHDRGQRREQDGAKPRLAGEGRSLGNLLFLAATRTLGTEEASIEAISRILKTRGRVIGVTWDHSHIHAELADGTRIERAFTLPRVVSIRRPSCMCERSKNV